MLRQNASIWLAPWHNYKHAVELVWKQFANFLFAPPTPLQQVHHQVPFPSRAYHVLVAVGEIIPEVQNTDERSYRASERYQASWLLQETGHARGPADVS